MAGKVRPIICVVGVVTAFFCPPEYFDALKIISVVGFLTLIALEDSFLG